MTAGRTAAEETFTTAPGIRLLVSAASAGDATAAIAGGTSIVDAKDPHRGALGAVSLVTLAGIAAAAGDVPVSAALGDDESDAVLEERAFAFATYGLAFVKVGFLGAADAMSAARRLAAVVDGVTRSGRPCGVVAVAYADAAQAGALDRFTVLRVATAAGASGVLLDTADKRGARLRELMSDRDLATWIASAHASSLHAAIAGQLTAGDMPFLRPLGADIIGVRGAACTGGRDGQVCAALVADLIRRLQPSDQRCDDARRSMSGNEAFATRAAITTAAPPARRARRAT